MLTRPALVLSVSRRYSDGSVVPEEMLYAFIKRCKVDNLESSRAPPIYIRGQASDRCSIILGGHVKVVAGEEAFESELGSWTILGLSALTQSVYIPDFTAKAYGPEKARVMFITSRDFVTFSTGKRVPRRSFDQSMASGGAPPGVLSSRVRRRDGTLTTGRRQRGGGRGVGGGSLDTVASPRLLLSQLEGTPEPERDIDGTRPIGAEAAVERGGEPQQPQHIGKRSPRPKRRASPKGGGGNHPNNPDGREPKPLKLSPPAVRRRRRRR
jgi:hypothetical protein